MNPFYPVLPADTATAVAKPAFQAVFVDSHYRNPGPAPKPGPVGLAPGGSHHYMPHYEDYYQDKTTLGSYLEHPYAQKVIYGAATAADILRKLAVAGVYTSAAVQAYRGFRDEYAVRKAALDAARIAEATRLAGIMVPAGPPLPPPSPPGSGYYTPVGDFSPPPSPHERSSSIAESMAAAEREVRESARVSRSRSPKGKEPEHAVATEPQYLTKSLVTASRAGKIRHALVPGIKIPKSSKDYPGYHLPTPEDQALWDAEANEAASYAGTHTLAETIDHMRKIGASDYILSLLTTAGGNKALRKWTYVPDPIKMLWPGNTERIHPIRPAGYRRLM